MQQQVHAALCPHEGSGVQAGLAELLHLQAVLVGLGGSIATASLTAMLVLQGSVSMPDDRGTVMEAATNSPEQQVSAQGTSSTCLGW